ncbi:MAG: dipeptidase [Myxococcales bacterium]|nr:MAG: dipeptidase [Myxococcales bacterium]
MANKIDAYIAANEARHFQEMFELLRIPSVSSQKTRQAETRRCAEWTAAHCRTIGLKAEVIDTQGHPVVLAEWLGKPGKPTILIYGHYDVQPEDPVKLWNSPPFEPTVKGCKLFARGAVDDKGQFFAHLKAIEAHLKTAGELPLNIKLILEGEEEIGSPSLPAFLERHQERLANNLLVISDSGMYKKGIPTITLGLRGISYFQLNLRSCKTDLHSGSFGGAAPNAGVAAGQIIAKLKDEKGKIQVPGFYDDVRPITAAEKASFDSLPFDEQAFMDEIGLKALVGEEGYSTLERMWVRPTLDVNGLLSGYTGEGAKTVIPAEAMIKVSMRLVPDQDPEKIRQAFEAYVRRITPQGVDLEVLYFQGSVAYVADPSHPAFKAAVEALEEGFNAKAAYTREGGSIPIVNDMTRRFGVSCLLLGLGLPDENAHAPNEYLDLDNWRAGVRTFAHFYGKLGELGAF